MSSLLSIVWQLRPSPGLRVGPGGGLDEGSWLSVTTGIQPPVRGRGRREAEGGAFNTNSGDVAVATPDPLTSLTGLRDCAQVTSQLTAVWSAPKDTSVRPPVSSRHFVSLHSQTVSVGLRHCWVLV